jgi:acetate---CoA ligase (ADP-forming)
VLEGTFTGLQAFRHLFASRDHRSRTAPDEVAGPGPEVAARWRERLLSEPPISEVEGLTMLGDYGIPVVAAAACASLEDTLAAAERIGWPVVLKTAAPGVAHKSHMGGVRLGIGAPDELSRVYLDMCERLGPRVTVQAMAPAGVELALGIVRDDQFGLLVMVAAGGVLVEVLRDRRFALCPVDQHGARRLLDQLGVRPLLDGGRGVPPADVEGVARAVAGLSVLGRDLGDRLDAIDVNPLIARADGCVAADVLVVARDASRGVG